ncbi:MAG: putative O-methyltransferase YrrM [Verrucomicrobiales bacterium]|jgi:predicted O-methyltransferase YrrM
MKWHVDEVIERGWVRNAAGEQLPVIGSVSREEAHVLGELIVENGFQRGIETGIAHGISTLALAEAFSETGGSMIGFDPCQQTNHGDSALETLNEYSLDSVFELRREPAQTGIAKLERESPVDFVFIDDVHNFQHRFVTFFLVDQLLRVGGVIAFHDLWLPSI